MQGLQVRRLMKGWGMEGATGTVQKGMEGLVIKDVKGLAVMSADVISER